MAGQPGSVGEIATQSIGMSENERLLNVHLEGLDGVKHNFNWFGASSAESSIGNVRVV